MKSKMFNPPHPGEVLKGLYLEELQLTITDAAKALNLSRQSLSEIVNGHTRISPETALRLAKAFNTEANMWLSMQQNYDLWRAEQNKEKLLRSVKVVYSGAS